MVRSNSTPTPTPTTHVPLTADVLHLLVAHLLLHQQTGCRKVTKVFGEEAHKFELVHSALVNTCYYYYVTGIIDLKTIKV